MMEVKAREKLASNLTAESKAYGYTLCVWGSGAILIGQYAVPTPSEVMLFVFGAVAGFAALVLGVYGTLFGEVRNATEDPLLAATMIHTVAAPVTVAVSYGITVILPPVYGFFLVGLNATVGYNVLLLFESVVYTELRNAEHRMFALAPGPDQ